VAVISVVLVVGARFGLASYFNLLTEREYQAKVAERGRGPLEALRGAETQALEQGGLPIREAILLLDRAGRNSAGGAVTPEELAEPTHFEGWTHASRPAPNPKEPESTP
jgi:hypothetical protein